MQDPIENLLSCYRAKMPKAVYLMRNEPRYSKVKHEVEAFVTAVLAEVPDAEISVAPDELIGTGLGLSIIADLLVLCDTHSLFPLLALADNIEVYSRADGRFCFALTFRDCYKAAPACIKYDVQKASSDR